jgi:hypothetical protein
LKALPSVSHTLRLLPIHWAIHLDIPQVVASLASYSCVDLKQKIKGGVDVIEACFDYDHVRCFAELIPFFTSKARELLKRAIRDPNPAFVKTILKTIDPQCSNSELKRLSRKGSDQHQKVVKKFVKAHPGDQRDHANLKVKSQTQRMISLAPIMYHRGYGDSDDEDRWVTLEPSWFDDYPGEGDCIVVMDPYRRSYWHGDFDNDFDSD